MKALVCKNCKGSKRAPGIASLPGGGPYLIGSGPPAWPFKFMCARCKKQTVLSAVEFGRLPELTAQQLRDLGQFDAVAKDWRGRGYKDNETSDLMDANIGLDEATRMERFQGEPTA